MIETRRRCARRAGVRALLLTVLALAAACAAPGPRVAVIAHRGEHLHHPENTLASVAAAIEIGADYVELDIRTTADGELVLMHGRSVESTTDGKGEVKNLTLAQIRELEAGVRFAPAFAGTRVPTLDEALALASGRIGLYADVKDASPEALLAALDRHGMTRRTVVYGRPSLLRELVRLRPGLRVMPEAVNADNLRELLQELPLRVVAFDDSDFDDATIQAARAARLQIYVDRLNHRDDAAHWDEAVQRGASGIQTDHPAELLEYLRSRGLR